MSAVKNAGVATYELNAVARFDAEPLTLQLRGHHLSLSQVRLIIRSTNIVFLLLQSCWDSPVKLPLFICHHRFPFLCALFGFDQKLSWYFFLPLRFLILHLCSVPMANGASARSCA